MIHGGMGREERLKAQESFKHDPEVQVLLATDAAGEGINLQRAHLMVNYDLPWNPNRLEQRFGRIHRIGQTEVCHLWNLVAEETREGDVYRRLLEKLEEARKALGGQVFDVLGKLQFEGRPLRELLIEAIRYGDQPEVRARLTTVVDHALDRGQLQDLLEERALAHDAMDASRVHRIREDMERAEARRLQPHYIESFFLEAFQRLGGTAKQREPRRYEVTHVPAPVRNRDRLIGIGEPVLPRYERIAFEKALIAPQGQPLAAFVCPGHPLLDAVARPDARAPPRPAASAARCWWTSATRARSPRVLFYLEHAIQDASLTALGRAPRRLASGCSTSSSTPTAHARHLHYAPYLDYRPLADGEPDVDAILARPECAWITRELEQKAQGHAIAHVVPEHSPRSASRELALIDKTEAAVKDRLTKEITYWDHRAEQLKLQEQAGKPNARLNSGEARKRADDLQARLQKRLEELKLEAPDLAAAAGGARRAAGRAGGPARRDDGHDRQPRRPRPSTRRPAAARARADRHGDRAQPRLRADRPRVREARLRHREPRARHRQAALHRGKGRVTGADTITVTQNEILYSLNKPDDFILAIVEFLRRRHARVHYLRRPFQREPDFGVTSVNYDFAELLGARGEQPS